MTTLRKPRLRRMGQWTALWAILGTALFSAPATAVDRANWWFKIEPPVAADLNPSPDVVEVLLVAGERRVDLGNGIRTRMYTYNGSVPGPTIKGNVGDTLIVHFINRLPEETTIHWHGLELPANMDGSNISQSPVPPGGYFRYEFKLLRASTFWYHPHVRTNE